MLEFNKKSLDLLIEESHKSPRKRSAKSMHAPEHDGPRMLAVCLQPDSYMVPHFHPAQFGEILIHVQGDMCLVIFDSDGKIKETHRINENGKRIIEIPPRTYHTVIALTKDSVLFEITQGPYVADSYKTFASWAPEEKDVEAGKKYWDNLRLKIHK